MKLYLSALIIFFLSAFAGVSNAQCGKERWDVKTLIDDDTVKIDFENTVPTTVSEQCSLSRPLKIKDRHRLASERTLYELTAYVIEFKEEADRDYHVVIEDPDTGETMVAEIVDPECPDIDNTSRYESLQKVRDWFKINFHPGSSFRKARKKVNLTGIGFFDFLHGQRGMAPNGREIHPVLSIGYAK